MLINICLFLHSHKFAWFQSFSALLRCWSVFITVLLFSALPNDMTLVWLSCVCVVMCCRSPTWTRSIPVCIVCRPWRNFISISNSVGGSCLETRTCQVVLRLVWLVALRHRISATYSCGTSRLVWRQLWSWLGSANMSNIAVWFEGTKLISLLIKW